jgi:hypothetical protein
LSGQFSSDGWTGHDPKAPKASLCNHEKKDRLASDRRSDFSGARALGRRGYGAVPTTLDARAGFSVFTWDASAHFEGSPFRGISVSDTFVQPWLGFRADFYPWRDWRFELGAMAEGFGVNGGVWGWSASALVSYSITRWLDVTGGFRALNSKGRGNGSGPFKRSIDFTGYGPVLGFGLRVRPESSAWVA